MSRIAYVDGVYQPLNLPGILVEDRGYQFADGVYEVCAIRNGLLLDEHAISTVWNIHLLPWICLCRCRVPHCSR